MKILSFERPGEKSKIGRFFLRKHNLKVLEKMVRGLPPIDRIHYTMEWHVYTTYVIFLVGQINPSVEFCFVEDGVYTYVQMSKKRKNCVERYLDRLAYGPWHSSVGIPGTLRAESYSYALFPDLLPDIFDKKRRVKIDLALLLEQIDENLLAEMTRTQSDDEIDTLIALDLNHKYTNGKEYRNTIVSCITETAAQNRRVAIKRHPADSGGVNYVPPGYQVKELLSSVPIELLYLRHRKSLRKIVGGLSTALLTARDMLPGAEVESIVSKKDLAREENAEAVLSFFSSLGVKIKVIE